MKKVLIANTSGLGVGGITTHMLNYISHTKSEYEYTVISTMYHQESVIGAFKKLGCTVIDMPDRKKNLLGYWFAIYSLMKKNAYDVIHVHGNSATMLLELMTAKANSIQIRIAHCHNSVCSHKVLHVILKPLFKSSYTIAVACSKVAGDWIYGKGNYVILKNGIDAGKYKFNAEERIKYRLFFEADDTTMLLGNVGNLVDQKNQSFLIPVIKALRSYYPIKLVIIGEGHNEKVLKQEIKNNGLTDIVKIYPYRNDIASCFQAFDCFVLPSKWEGLPMVLIEAQTSGLPCFVSDVVTDEVLSVPDILKRIPLKENEWIEILKTVEKNDNRKKAFYQVLNNGYDMVDCVKALRKIYG